MKTHKRGMFQEQRLIGGTVSQHSADVLGLLSLYLNKSRSTIVRELIEHKIDSEIAIDEMIRELGTRAHKALKVDGGRVTKTLLYQHERKIREQLRKKKISPDYINRIIEEMKRHGTDDQEDNPIE